MKHFTRLHLFALGLILALACSAPVRLMRPEAFPSGNATSPARKANPLPTQAHPITNTPTRSQTIQPSLPTASTLATPEIALTAVENNKACSYNPITAQFLTQTSQGEWLDWVAQLSGAEAITLNGEKTWITTRFSPALFNRQPNARAFDWLLQTVQEWYPPDQITMQPFQVEFEDQHTTWKNLILTIPGQTHPDEVVILSAHLDSTSNQPNTLAPGAEDNASGSATLIEAARLFRQARFARTLQIIWFTGEEQGLLGSRAFLQQANREQIVGAINLDMFGYDSDDDRCFELHVGNLPQSGLIGQCITTVIAEYQIDLRYDFLEEDATDRSDHGSFWEAGLGSVELLENLFDNDQPGGCSNADPSPNYHTTRDVVENINAQSAFFIAKAALAAAAGLARPLP